MKLCSLCYLPKLHIAPERTGAFLANLLRYKHRYPIIVFSDAEWHSSVIRALEPAKLFKAHDPEAVRGEVWHHVANYVYLQGVQMVEAEGVDYFLMLETDCRVHGDYWDEAIFDDFFDQPGEKVLGGTLFAWHPFNNGLDYAVEFTRLMNEANVNFHKKPVPVPNVFVYGGRGSCEQHRVSAYPNGALSIAKTAFVREAYGNRDIRLAAQEGSAWDAQLGYHLFEIYGAAGYRRLASLTTVFSTYGDLITNESTRLYMLRCGQVRGVHQVKSEVVE